jgi:undecaprenyl diphosphate synthase
MANLLPTHVGIIMDGNGRWAKKRLMPRSYGHKAGMNNLIALAEHAQKTGIRYLTVYALSTENLARPQEEVEGLYNLIRGYFSDNVKKLFAQNAAVKIIGDITALPQDIQTLLREAESSSPKGAKFTLIFALNYGSRDELKRAFNKAIYAGKEVSEQDIAALLDTADIPDPDLIIRTGGEVRLSNFLLYQAAYAELYFCDTLVPDFDAEAFNKAIQAFQGRNRRFGKV